MGKYTNLLAGIFVFSMGYFLESMYNSVSREFAEALEVLPVPIGQIIQYVRFIFIGIGTLLILAGLVGIAISMIKKSRKKKEDEEPARERRPEEGYREEKYPEEGNSSEQEYRERPSRRDTESRREYRKEPERKDYPKDKKKGKKSDYGRKEKYRDERERR